MNFELTVLGSSSAMPTSVKYPTAQVLRVHERFFLIDCGEGTQIQLRKLKFGFGKINHIFISHMHGDHVFGLFGLFSTFNLLGRKTDLHIYGHSDLQKLIDFFLKKFAQEVQYRIVVHTIGSRSKKCIYEDKVVEVFAFPLKHRVPTFGFLFREKERQRNIRKECIDQYQLSIQDIRRIKEGEDFKTSEGKLITNSELTIPPPKVRTYAFCSDTAYYKKIVDYIKSIDLLYHEATFLESDKQLAKKTGHSTAGQAAQIAKEAGVKKLLIGHFSPRYKNVQEMLDESRKVFPATYVAEDGSSYKIPLEK